jgi:hypothetical protein
MKAEAEILAETFESVRNLSKFYLSQLGDINVYEQLTVNGKTFNSPYWIAAHLTWTEHSLLIEGMGAELMPIDWLEKFSIGTTPENGEDLPKFEEVLIKMDEVHEYAMKIIKALTDEQLDEPNNLGLSFGGVNNKRAIIKHAIRHEPMHIGQISWYLKLNDVKMP